MTDEPENSQDDPADNAPRQKSAYALQLLDLLGRENFEFRALAEAPHIKGKSNTPQMIRRVGTFDRHMQELRRLNDAGYGIFVQINEADGKGHVHKNIIAAPCVFADFDGTPISNLERLQLKPHAVFQTSPGKYHAYWRISDLPLDQFTPLQCRFIQLFDSDPTPKDLPRVMRLPGFLHQKNPDEPFLVAPVEVADHALFTQAELVAALEAAEKAHGIQAKASNMPSPVPVPGKGDVKRSEAILRFLVDEGHIDPGGYEDWHRLAMALKNDHGEAGWPLWHAISAAAPGYEGEEACRAKWDSFGKTEGPPLTMATFLAMAKDHGWKASASLGQEKESEGGKGASKGPAPAIVVLALVDEAGDELWLDLQGRAHVTFIMTDPDVGQRKLHVPIDGSAYKAELSARYAEACPDKVLSKDQLTLAVGLLAHKARNGGKHPTFLRSGMDEGALYIALGRKDGAAVRIDRNGDTVVKDVPLRFIYRGEGQGELPLPEPGGTLADFERHYNLSKPDVLRMVAVQIVALVGAPSYPIGLIEGPQGTCKSTLADMTLSLVDPPAERKQGRSTYSSDERNLYIRASHAHMLYFDNISIVDQAASDALCRMATGGSFSTRVLYTDHEEHTVSVLRPVIATCIGTPTSRGDFLDRCVSVTTLPVNKRRTEASVWLEFEADRPKLFGFLLGAIQLSLQNLEEVQKAIDAGEIGAPRLADFAAVIEGAAEMLGLQRGEFSQMLVEDQRRLQAEAALGHPLILALHDHFSKSGASSIDMTARELLAAVQPSEIPPKGWPVTSQVKRALLRNAAGLSALGLAVEIGEASGHDKVCRYRISKLDHFQASSGLRTWKPPF